MTLVHKKAEKEGYIPEVSAVQKEAIEKEIDVIIQKLMKAFDHEECEQIKMVYETVSRQELVDELTEILTRNVARRLTNDGLKVVRIFGVPKLPKRAELENYLIPYGVVSLKKSDKKKMFVCALKTFEAYDRLCAVATTKFSGDLTVHFKPFHLLPKEKADQSMLRIKRKQMINAMIERSNVDLLSKDWPAQEEAEKAKLAEENAGQANESNETDRNEVVTKVNKVYLHEEFKVIDEVHESDSDVEFINQSAEVVDLVDDGGNNGNAENNDGGNNGIADNDKGENNDNAGNDDGGNNGSADNEDGRNNDSAGNDGTGNNGSAGNVGGGNDNASNINENDDNKNDFTNDVENQNEMEDEVDGDVENGVDYNEDDEGNDEYPDMDDADIPDVDIDDVDDNDLEDY